MTKAGTIKIADWAFWTIVLAGIAVFGLLVFCHFRDDVASDYPLIDTIGAVAIVGWLMMSLLILVIQDRADSKDQKQPHSTTK